MKVKLILTIYIIAQTNFSVGQNFSNPFDKYKLDQILEKCESIDSELRSALDSKSQCTSFKEKKSGSKCTFLDFCQVFSENKDSPYLYINEQGRKIPNYSLSNVEAQVSRCFQSIESKYNKDKNKKSGITPDNAYQRHTLKINQSRIALLQAVRDEKSEVEFIKFEQAAAEIGLEEVNNLAINPFRRTKDEILDDISNIEKKSGVKLSSNVKEKYIDSIEAMNFFSQHDIKKNNIFPHNYKTSINQNPFLNLSLLTEISHAGSEEKVLKNQEKIINAIERVQNIFKETKEDILKILDNKITNDPGNKSKYDEMKKRINTITYLFPPVDQFLSRMSCPGPNAFYNPQNHSFTLCSQIMELPDTGIKTIIAHELGHSIDPCIISQPLYKISEMEEVFKVNINEEQKKKLVDSMKKSGRLLFELNQPKVDEIYAVDFFNSADNDLKQAYTSYKKTPHANSVYLKDNPMTDIIDCLSSEDSLGARKSSKELARSNLEDAITRAKQAGANEASPGFRRLLSARENFNDIYDEIGACSFLPGKSQIQEAWSDWIAAEVIGNNISKVDEAKKMDRAFESFGFFLATRCENGAPEVVNKAHKFMQEMGCVESGDMSKAAQIQTIIHQSNLKEDVHSHSIDRVQKIFISHPEIKKSLGCDDSAGGKRCE